MSERQPRKSPLSPSPLPLALFIVFAALIGLGALYLFTIGMTAPAPTQTGAQQNALAQATATVEADTEEEPNYDLTPTRVLPVPTDAPVPPGAKSPIPLPPPTEISYTPGPTASLEVLVPIEEWREYVNEQQGFTIKYPPNWYLNPGPTGQTTQIFSYDFNDPALDGYKGPPLDLTKIEIGITQAQQFLPNESIHEWIYRTGRLGEDDKLIQEEELPVDGLPALRQLVDFEYGGLIEGVYVKRTNDVIIIGQHYREDWAIPNQVFALLVQNFRIQKERQ